jgi:hypothetical protein
MMQDAGIGGIAHLCPLSFADPFGTLWFIHLLPAFFVAIKPTKNVPVWIMWPAVAARSARPSRSAAWPGRR